MIPSEGKILGFRFRHRVAHISISLTVMFIAGTALAGHIIGIQWTSLYMTPNSAICLFLLAMLEFFEAFNLKM